MDSPTTSVMPGVPYPLCVEAKGQRSMDCAASSDQKTGLHCVVIHMEVLGRERNFSLKRDKLMPSQHCAGTLAHFLFGSREEQGAPYSSAFSSSYALIQTL